MEYKGKRSRYVKSLENLSERTKSLPPLNCGDHVMIQNQTGHFPNNWGESGVVMEFKRLSPICCQG